MARPLRIEFPNACYHVCNKAAQPSGLFPGEPYYQAFLEGVKDAARRFNVEVLGWCLLRSEYQLLVRTPEGNLSRFMRQVDGLYTQYFQRTKRRHGPVFRARYKSVLFQPELYLAPLSRFLHNLPRTARQNPVTWPWSSLDCYLTGTVREVPLRHDLLLDLFGKGSAGARTAYATYVRAPGDQEVNRFFGKKNQLSVLGDEKFRARIKTQAQLATAQGARTAKGVGTVAINGSLSHTEKGAPPRKRPTSTRIVSSVADTFKVSGTSILRSARGPGSRNVPRWVAMYLCQEAGGITLQKIATQFGLQRYGTVSTTIGKLKDEFVDDPPLVSRVERIRQQLYA